MATTDLKPLVYVRWLDASHPRGSWQSVARVKRRPMMTETAGFLVLDEPDQIIVAGTIDRVGGAHSQFTGEICIPRACVVSIVAIKRPRPPRKPKAPCATS